MLFVWFWKSTPSGFLYTVDFVCFFFLRYLLIFKVYFLNIWLLYFYRRHTFSSNNTSPRVRSIPDIILSPGHNCPHHTYSRPHLYSNHPYPQATILVSQLSPCHDYPRIIHITMTHLSSYHTRSPCHNYPRITPLSMPQIPLLLTCGTVYIKAIMRQITA